MGDAIVGVDTHKTTVTIEAADDQGKKSAGAGPAGLGIPE
jgi:hypothetical protein